MEMIQRCPLKSEDPSEYIISVGVTGWDTPARKNYTCSPKNLNQ